MQALLSPKKYIQTKARSLPVIDCYVNQDWQDSGIASIIISRKQPGGNFIAGTYLVDLYAAGVKDTFYFFNMTVSEYEELIQEATEKDNLEKCTYPMAHNIIYEGIAYADDLGLKPHKDFEITRFILFEDTEDIEEIPIECGLDGKPCVVVHPSDPKTKIITHLINKIGKENFTVLMLGDESDDESDEVSDDDESDDWQGTQEDLEEEAGKALLEKSIAETLSKVEQTEVILLAEYEKHFGKPGKNELLDNKRIIPHNVHEDMTATFDILSESEMEEIEELESALQMKKVNRSTIQRIKAKIKKYPDIPELYEMLCYAYNAKDKRADSINLLTYAINKFPDQLTLRLLYGCTLLVNNQLVDFNDLFKDRLYLDEIAEDRTSFSYSEILLYAKMIVIHSVINDQLYRARQVLQVVNQMSINEVQMVNLIMMRSNIIKEMKKKIEKKTG